MDTFLSLLGLFIVVAIVWVIAKFVLKLTARVIGCGISALVVIGLFAIFWFIIRT
jgi:hypothetical protein